MRVFINIPVFRLILNDWGSQNYYLNSLTAKTLLEDMRKKSANKLRPSEKGVISDSHDMRKK